MTPPDKATVVQRYLIEAHRALAQKPADFEGALADLRSACRVDPQSVIVHYEMGMAFQQAGRLEEALLAYQRAHELKPFAGMDRAVATALGVTFLLLKRFGEAAAVLGPLYAQPEKFNRPGIGLWYGEALAGSGDVAGAVRVWKEVEAMPPAYPNRGTRRAAQELLRKYENTSS